MKYLLNHIGITALSVLLATATCNNSSDAAKEETYTESSISAPAPETAEQLAPTATADTVKKERDSVLIKTNFGDMVVVLYNETPLHHDNFLKLVKSNFYNGILFHRVIRNFMIQTGDPLSKDADPNNDGSGGPGYLIPAEISPLFRHNKGSLAAARTENPERASSGSQFYICHVATPFLDGQYTVFGETVKGLDIIDKIANVPTGMNDRPNAPVKIISMKHINAPKSETKGK
jgi:cyclophilin family peptidyl-prolyl cis-trans isomerase